MNDWLQKGDRVCLVPHRHLHLLPIHALSVGGEPLIARHPVVYAPAASILLLTQDPAKGTDRLQTCAAFGVVFAAEAEAVAELFGTSAVPTSELSPGRVAELCADKDVCHFSCHGVFNVADPMSSGLLLGNGCGTPDGRLSTGDGKRDQDGLLTAREIMALRLDAELVCLSARESGVSEVSEGDDLTGLIRAFLYAGASSLVTSLWAVDPDTTRDFMVAFYRALLAQPPDAVDKSEALRAAQLKMMQVTGPRAVFHWAPFVLTGDWH